LLETSGQNRHNFRKLTDENNTHPAASQHNSHLSILSFSSVMTRQLSQLTRHTRDICYDEAAVSLTRHTRDICYDEAAVSANLTHSIFSCCPQLVFNDSLTRALNQTL